MTAFSIAFCAAQEFGARLAPSFALCEQIARERGDRSAAERHAALFAEHLHAAMGHRPHQPEF
ncbi:MAG: hypothetical protein ACO3HF_01050 [Burkholderiaceae bacterium]